MTRYRLDDLLRWTALGACRIEFGGNDLVLERPGYMRPTTRELTDDERAMLVEVDAELLGQRPPWSEPTPADRAAAFVAAERERTAHWSPAIRAAVQLRHRRDRVRYGCRRLRAGHEWRWQRPLAVVRVETAAALRQLGHERFARRLAGGAMPVRRGPVVQMELGL